MSNANSTSIAASEDAAANAVSKRYEGLMALRTKAVRGKGAWYWAHFEPILIINSDTNLPKAVKLKCTLCNASFSASNPSRTASEHLKRGTCPNFSLTLKPISQLPPLASPSSQPNHRKRSSEFQQAALGTSLNACPINMVDPSQFENEMRPLALLEDNEKKLKCPKSSSIPALSSDQINKAFEFLADWFYDSCGSVTLSSLEHPKFKAFLNHLNLPQVSKRELFSSARLDSKFEEARRKSEARIRDAAFFQVACDGWKCKASANGDKCSVKFTVNLPNGRRVFHKVVYFNVGKVPSDYVEEVLWETIQGICGNNIQRCVGIVSDKYKSKALRYLELQNSWMVNISCQLQGFFSLIKDFHRELPLISDVTEKCLKIANLINSQPKIRNCFHKFRLPGLELAGFIRVPSSKCDLSKNFTHFIAMLDDILTCSRILHLVVLDDSYKAVCLDNLVAREVTEMVQNSTFWNNVEAARSLVKLVMEICKEIEAERPLVGRCLPLWEEFRANVKRWCSKYSFSEGPILQIVDKRFNKNYHPSWSAAFVLDPLYLVKDASGKYLPPFKFLTHDQEKDVDKLVTRLVSGEDAHIALMELMKWRSEGLDPLYAQAVQVKEWDPVLGKMKIANPQSSRLVWETYLKEFKSLSKVAARLLSLHATSCGIKCDWSMTKCLGVDKSQKLLFVAANGKLERGEFSSAEEKDDELLRTMSGEDEMMNEVIAHTSSV